MDNIDYAAAQRYLTRLDSTASFREALDGVKNGFTFQTFDDLKSRKSPTMARILNGEFAEVARELAQLNVSGAGVFVTVNQTNMSGRTKDCMTAVRAIWVDDDTGSNISTPLDPHIVVESSPNKFQRLFCVVGLTVQQFPYYQRS